MHHVTRILPLVAFTAAACGGITDKGSSPVDPVEYQRMVGSWETDCAAQAEKPALHETKLLKFDNTRGFIKEKRVFADDQCQSPLYLETITGTSELTGRNEDDHDARDIQFNVDAVTYKPLSAAGAARLNADRACGVVDWRDGAELAVLGFDCYGLTLSADSVIKDLVEVRTDTLYFGQRRLLETGALDVGRPTAVNRDLPFHQR